jgi:hypothetical protein
VTDSVEARLMPTTVIRDGKVRAAGRRMEQVIVYDWGFEHAGQRRQQRSFLLLDDGFQINQPVMFPPERAIDGRAGSPPLVNHRRLTAPVMAPQWQPVQGVQRREPSAGAVRQIGQSARRCPAEAVHDARG